DRRFVLSRLTELREYLAYFEKIRRAPRPGSLRTEKALADLVERLEGKADPLALPQEEGEKTEAGRLYRSRLEEAGALQAAVKKARDWYQTLADDAGSLRSFTSPVSKAGSVDWPEWYARVEALLRKGRNPPFREA